MDKDDHCVNTQTNLQYLSFTNRLIARQNERRKKLMEGMKESKEREK